MFAVGCPLHVYPEMGFLRVWGWMCESTVF